MVMDIESMSMQSRAQVVGHDCIVTSGRFVSSLYLWKIVMLCQFDPGGEGRGKLSEGNTTAT